jgi:hypothetical protein
METTYVGETKLIKMNDGRLVAMAGADHAMNIEWAVGILNKPSVVFPNGKQSHDVALEMLEKHEEAILDHLRFTV